MRPLPAIFSMFLLGAYLLSGADYLAAQAQVPEPTANPDQQIPAPLTNDDYIAEAIEWAESGNDPILTRVIRNVRETRPNSHCRVIGEQKGSEFDPVFHRKIQTRYYEDVVSFYIICFEDLDDKEHAAAHREIIQIAVDAKKIDGQWNVSVIYIKSASELKTLPLKGIVDAILAVHNLTSNNVQEMYSNYSSTRSGENSTEIRLFHSYFKISSQIHFELTHDSDTETDDFNFESLENSNFESFMVTTN